MHLESIVRLSFPNQFNLYLKLVHFDGPFVFTADDLLCAIAEIMGKSTYGAAYRATLEDGNHIAVKRLREKITKG